MTDMLFRFTRALRVYGPRATLATAYRRLTAPGLATAPAQITPAGKVDILGFYRQFLGAPHGDEAAIGSAPGNLLQWVIPDFGFGSGGHLSIFRYINLLAERGFSSHVVVLPPHGWDSAAAVQRAIAEWYFPLRASIGLGPTGFRPALATFATGWQTAGWVAQHRASAAKLYFVQDFEPWFAPVSSDYYLMENTYRLGLKGITAGGFLAEKLARDYGMECEALSFGIEPMYRPAPKRPSPNFNILFYSRHVTPRRLFELGLIALEQVCAEEPGAAVIFVGGDVGHVEIPFHHLNGGQQPQSALPDLYAQCDLALVLSGTNLSLMPLEIAACGCPVVMNDTPAGRWLLPEDAAFYAPTEPGALARAMLSAIRDPQARAARAARALELARNASWETEADRMARAICRFSAARPALSAPEG